MEPIRGPLDYHRYPPKNKQPQQHPTASMSSSDPTPHQPRRRAASSQPGSGAYGSTGHPAAGRGSAGRGAANHSSTSHGSSGHSSTGHGSTSHGSTGAAGERVLRRPHERQAQQERQAQAEFENIVVPAEHAALDSEAYNDWLEGRHRGPGGRRRRRIAHVESGDPRSAGQTSRHVAHDGGEPGQRANRKKSRHLRSLWERRRKTERPALKRFHTPFWKIARRVTICLLVIGAGELVVAALTTPRMAVQNVEIVGTQVTPIDALQPITQQLIGQNWIRVRTQSAALAAAKLPSVKEARVERVLSLPPMKLALRITERQPFARVGGGDTWWIVDRNGIPFRRATSQDEKLHAVTSPALRPERIRLGVALPNTSWKPFVILADALENDMKNGGQWQLRRTYLDKFGFASLRLTGGSNNELLVRLGGGQWPQKLQRARQALDYFAATGRRAAALNLVSYNMPTWTPYRPKETDESSSDGASSALPQTETSSDTGTPSDSHTDTPSDADTAEDSGSGT